MPFEHPEHYVTGESVHSVICDFEHLDFEHSENMAQTSPREKAYMNTGRDLKNYAPVALTPKFLSNFFSNIFMKDSVTWREV